MKKLKISLLVIFCISNLNATIYTVDNKIPTSAQYATLLDAHDAVDNSDDSEAGKLDTIMVYPSPNTYKATDISKRVVIIGTGWKEQSESVGFTEIVGIMNFSAGSNSSKIISFKSENIQIYANNVEIRRNKLNHIHIHPNCKQILIIGCDIRGGWDYTIAFQKNTEVFIANSFIENNDLNDYCIGIYLADGSASTISIKNCIFYHTGHYLFGTVYLDKANFEISNSYFANGGISYTNNNTHNIHHNICRSDQLPDGYDNIRYADMSTVFVDWENGNYHLITGSPAIGSGFGGTDMGIYGGINPFVDGGYPGIPTIIEFESDLEATKQDGLDVHIKAKSNR